MRKFLIILFALVTINGFSQMKLEVFEGILEYALDSIENTNKNVLLIIGSNYCGNYVNFTENVLVDSSIVSYINKEFLTIIFRADLASKEEKKQMKKYNKSWPGWPQFYILDSNEKLITDFTYPNYTSNEEFLMMLRKYQTIEKEWKEIKKISKKEQLSFDQLQEYIFLRDLNYSSFQLIHINKQISKYFSGIEPEDYSNKEYWSLFKRYVKIHDLGLDPKLFDFVAKNKEAFQKENGVDEVSNYLLDNYIIDTQWRKEKDINKIEKSYPYNTIDEAKVAIKIYRQSKSINSLIKPFSMLLN